MTSQYLCPLCQQPLTLQEKSYCCENKHSFDLAKEGYVNLLPVQFKHSKDPGDNKAMVNARRAFLEKGYYQPLVDKLLAIKYQHAPEAKHIFDAGCGEGFYTHQHKCENNDVYGVDIAKEAVKKAAKKYKDCNFSVGTLSKLPFNDQKFDWLYSIYAPILESEFTRILVKQGFLLTVTPAANHLIELKDRIYQEANNHDESREAIEHLKLIHQEKLSYVMTLETGEDILNLLSMTPFAFKASESVKENLSKEAQFKCQADFLIKLYQKH